MGGTENERKIRIGGLRGLLVGIVLGVSGVLVAGHVLVGGGLIRLPWTRFEGSSSSSDSTDASTLEQLQIALAAEVQARRELADGIAKLNEALSLLRGTRDEAIASRLVDAEARPDGSVSDEGGVEISGFDDEALLSRGIHSSEIARLRDLWESHEMDRAWVTDRALREGWFFQQPHRAEIARLERELRENLTDEDYDLYLYARGEPNQIRAGEVLRDSSAGRAGMRSGDIILRYDDVRIFEPGTLLRASSSGNLGEWVTVMIDRDGVRIPLDVERGPLGVVTQHRRGPPLPD